MEKGEKQNPSEEGGDGFDAVVEAEIDAFYKAIASDDDVSSANSDDNWTINLNIGDRLAPAKGLQPDDHEEDKSERETLGARVAQPHRLVDTNLPCVFLSVRRMFESYEFQLWDMVPVVTIKELIEDLTEIAPENMRLYLKNGTIMEDAKTLKDYGVIPEVNDSENPEILFVGFRVGLEEVSEDEADEEEEDDEAADFELSPGLEYFETVSDIDFTDEIARDRDFDDWEPDVDASPEYSLVKPVNGSVDSGPARHNKAATAFNKPVESGMLTSEPEGVEPSEEEFTAFTMRM